MYKLIKLDSNELKATILKTSEKSNISPGIIEKDLWVSIVLDYLFNYSPWKNHIVFKGGTSLSKAFHIIERFSEDIDVVLDWNVVEFAMNTIESSKSNNQRRLVIEYTNKKLDLFLESECKNTLIEGISLLTDKRVNITFDPREHSLIFEYPRLFDDKSLLSTIKIEIGVFASWMPNQKVTIEPIIREYFPSITDVFSIPITVTNIERTFWEKILILHQESHRGVDSIIPRRYSRHYYDVYQMYQKGVFVKAIENIDELKKTVEFTSKFYPKSWARYDLAKPGSVSLMPPFHSIKDLKKDYESMKIMIYGECPSFDKILKTIQIIETEINGIK